MTSQRRLNKSIELPVSVEEAFAYHERPGALSRLVPPWESLRVVQSDGSITAGSRVKLKTNLGPVPLYWNALHQVYDPPHRFVDVQESGPFKSWEHEHLFEPLGSRGCKMTDSVTYQLPGGSLGRLVGSSLIANKLEVMFDYRHRVTSDDLALAAQYPSETLRIAVSGSSGLVGADLCSLFSLLGHRVEKLQRGEPRESLKQEHSQHFPWSETPELNRMEGLDAVVHLAGKPIAEGRWNEKTKQQIMESRTLPTRVLCEHLAKLKEPPRVLICASATGIYGDRGDELVDESSTCGEGFLADVAKQWEAACAPALEAGIRVVNMRIGIVVSPKGGALAKLLLPAKLGLNGPMGSGRQWMSWIAQDDLLGAIYHSMMDANVSGPVNAVAPEPLTNRDFASVLGSVLRRPAFIPVPAFAMRVGLGEMAEHLLLGGVRVRPTRLLDSGYRFRFVTLRECLLNQLGVSS